MPDAACDSRRTDGEVGRGDRFFSVVVSCREVYSLPSCAPVLKGVAPFALCQPVDSGSACTSAPHPRFNSTEKDGGVSMANAQCTCGILRLVLREPSKLVVACHCFACQRRTGAPFGVNAFYAIDTVEISGRATEFVHVGESGRNVRLYFCPTCGSTVYWKPDALPSMIGVAAGALADPDFPAPANSIFERSKHPWIHFEGVAEHFPASAIREYSPELTRRSNACD